jgi:hypothetical protein
MPFAHVYGEATLAGRASAVSIPTHHFPAAGAIEIICEIVQKGSQFIELTESFSPLVEEMGWLSWPSSTSARLTCVARHIVQPSVRSKKAYSAERIVLQSCRA